MTLNAILSLPLLRQQLRQARRSLTEQQQNEHAQLLANHLLFFMPSAVSLSIGVTSAFDGEINPLLATQALQLAGYSTYLPVLRTDKHLEFALWHADSDMVINQFGILEPKDAQPVTVEALDFLLVPLVGVDQHGNRLGMGGGYYDRTLGSSHKRPYLIGIAHYCQLVDSLPLQPWDVPLDALVTEQGVVVWHEFRKGR